MSEWVFVKDVETMYTCIIFCPRMTYTLEKAVFFSNKIVLAKYRYVKHRMPNPQQVRV